MKKEYFPKTYHKKLITQRKKTIENSWIRKNEENLCNFIIDKNNIYDKNNKKIINDFSILKNQLKDNSTKTLYLLFKLFYRSLNNLVNSVSFMKFIHVKILKQVGGTSFEIHYPNNNYFKNLENQNYIDKINTKYFHNFIILNVTYSDKININFHFKINFPNNNNFIIIFKILRKISLNDIFVINIIAHYFNSRYLISEKYFFYIGFLENIIIFNINNYNNWDKFKFYFNF